MTRFFIVLAMAGTAFAGSALASELMPGNGYSLHLAGQDGALYNRGKHSRRGAPPIPSASLIRPRLRLHDPTKHSWLQRRATAQIGTMPRNIG